MIILTLSIYQVEEVFLWDDRVKQLEGFQAFLLEHQQRGRLKKFEVIYVGSISFALFVISTSKLVCHSSREMGS